MGVSTLVKWLRHKDLRGQSFPCSCVFVCGVNQTLILHLCFSVGTAHVDTAIVCWQHAVGCYKM